MKLLILPLLLACTLSAQDGAGIDFLEKPFAELIAQAKQENKLIFVDAYTTWCGPCKMMTAKVFPDQRVGEVYNARFINAKFDMEKGEGPGLAKRYSVSAYPTYLFVNGDGELVHKGLGYIPIPALLELADAAVSDESLGALGARYAAGERDPTFVNKYARVLTDNYEQARADRVVNDYLDGQSDWSTPEHLALLLASPGEVGDKRMRYLLEHAGAVDAATHTGATVTAVQQVLVNAYHRSHRKRNLVAPAEIETFYAEEAGPLGAQLLAQYRLIYYERQDDMEQYVPAALTYYAAYPSTDYTELNSLAWTFYEHASDPGHLAQAIRWAEASIALHPYYANLDTLAWLYQKTGQQEKAEEAARRAITYAKAEELDYSDTEKIFE